MDLGHILRWFLVAPCALSFACGSDGDDDDDTTYGVGAAYGTGGFVTGAGGQTTGTGGLVYGSTGGATTGVGGITSAGGTMATATGGMNAAAGAPAALVCPAMQPADGDACTPVGGGRGQQSTCTYGMVNCLCRGRNGTGTWVCFDTANFGAAGTAAVAAAGAAPVPFGPGGG